MTTKKKPTKRPTDVASNAVHVMRVLTGEALDIAPSKISKRGAKAGALGGPARALALTPEQRKEIAQAAARARWKKT